MSSVSDGSVSASATFTTENGLLTVILRDLLANPKSAGQLVRDVNFRSPRRCRGRLVFDNCKGDGTQPAIWLCRRTSRLRLFGRIVANGSYRRRMSNLDPLDLSGPHPSIAFLLISNPRKYGCAAQSAPLRNFGCRHDLASTSTLDELVLV